jgi:hypothetical protein
LVEKKRKKVSGEERVGRRKFPPRSNATPPSHTKKKPVPREFLPTRPLAFFLPCFPSLERINSPLLSAFSPRRQKQTQKQKAKESNSISLFSKSSRRRRRRSLKK